MTSWPVGNSWPGGSGGGALPASVLEAITSVAFNFYLDTTTGVVEAGGAGTGVTTWEDQSPAGADFTAAGLPALVAMGGPNNVPCITLDGTDDTLACAWIPPAPGTTPSFYEFVVRADTPANSDQIGGATASTRQALQWLTSGPQVRASAGVNIAVASVNNTWARVRAYFSNTTADFVQFGSNISTGVSAGNNAGSVGYSIGPNFPTFSFVAAYSTAGLPTQAERAAVDAIWAARYGI